MTRGRRIAVAGVLVLATVVLLVAVLSTWVKRQALDTKNWTNTSAQILESKNVQAALGAYLVNQLFTNVDVAGQLQQTLPSQFQALAGPAAGGLRQIADRAAPRLLARPRVQDAWRLSNENAHLPVPTEIPCSNCPSATVFPVESLTTTCAPSWMSL